MSISSRLAKGLCIIVIAVGLTVNIAHAAVGRTQGSFDVSTSGAAAYQIPIWVPPGPKGIQPDLALTYNSQAGDGMMGPGWSLSGLSSITRCNKTFAQDGAAAAVTYSSSDGLCLDGKRLRLFTGVYGSNGSTYQTEQADFSLVTLNGTLGDTTTYFTVKGKNGLIYEYGNTADSRYGFSWLLNKVADRAGNNYIVEYGVGSLQGLACRRKFLTHQAARALVITRTT